VRQRGFTIVELMITVAIVLILTLTLTPLISGFTGQTESTAGLNGIVDFLQRARVQASVTGRAQQVRFVRTTLNGELRLDRGATASCCCAGTPADPFQATNGGEVDVDALDVQRISAGLVVKESEPQEIWGGTEGICFTPDGRVLNPSTLLPFASDSFGAGTVVFKAEEQDVVFNGPLPGPNGSPITGRAWNIVLEYSGQARWEPRR
jgi:prepilin-type N-terminal cleavage/methylation domain-containing protein